MSVEQVQPQELDGTIGWYARRELAGPWRISACRWHGRELERHRFRYLGESLEKEHGQMSRLAEHCAICRRPELAGEVERCTCEEDSARCPEHHNRGCGW